MKFYYVAVVGGDIWMSSPSLERLVENLKESEMAYPRYFKEHKVQIITYEEKEILEWNPPKR